MSLCLCPICGKEKKNLTKHINMAHNMSKEEFLDIYPNTKMISEETFELLSTTTKEHWKDKEYAEKCSSYAKSNKNIGGKNLKGIPKSEITKQRMKNFSNSERGKEIRSNNLTTVLNTLWKNEDYIKDKREKGRKQMLKNLENEHYGHKRYKYNNISYRSTWEVAVAKILDELNIKYEYEKHRFEYYKDNVKHIYIPDFYLCDFEIFLEVKPDCFINKDTDIKLKSVLQSGYLIYYINTNESNKIKTIINTCVEGKPIELLETPKDI